MRTPKDIDWRTLGNAILPAIRAAVNERLALYAAWFFCAVCIPAMWCAALYLGVTRGVFGAGAAVACLFVGWVTRTEYDRLRSMGRKVPPARATGAMPQAPPPPTDVVTSAEPSLAKTATDDAYEVWLTRLNALMSGRTVCQKDAIRCLANGHPDLHNMALENTKRYDRALAKHVAGAQSCWLVVARDAGCLPELGDAGCLPELGVAGCLPELGVGVEFDA